MTDHERAIVNMFNNHLEQKDKPNGIAHRKKQHRFTSQLCDVLVDSEHDSLYLAIEAKSLKAHKNNKLYFSQHFSENNEAHQVERISNFIHRSGRLGLLCLELKHGRGKPRECYMLPWHHIQERYENDEVGLTIEEIKELGQEIKRDGSEYVFTSMLETFLIAESRP